MDKVSIIVTTYKGTDTVFRSVESAMNQDYSNFEVIVVDDNGQGKEDQRKTEEELSCFIGKDNFRYIAHKKNVNGSAARNTGIKNSNGDYIAFLDDDDILHTDSVRLRYNKLSSLPDDYGIVFSSFTQYSADGNKDYECVYNIDGDILIDYLEQKYHSPSSVIMIRRAVVDKIGYWDESFRRHQDWEFITRILVEYKACSIDELSVDRIVTWRNNAKKPEQFEINRLFYLDKMQQYISGQSEAVQRKVYYVHYTDIGKNYLKSFKIWKSLKWAYKSGNLVMAVYDYIKSILTYIMKQKKEHNNDCYI